MTDNIRYKLIELERVLDSLKYYEIGTEFEAEEFCSKFSCTTNTVSILFSLGVLRSSCVTDEIYETLSMEDVEFILKDEYRYIEDNIFFDKDENCFKLKTCNYHYHYYYKLKEI